MLGDMCVVCEQVPGLDLLTTKIHWANILAKYVVALRDLTHLYFRNCVV